MSGTSWSSAISLLDNETPVAECQELCCSRSQNCPFQPHDAHFLRSLTTGGRRFMHNWYKIYPWLSICKDAGRKLVFLRDALEIVREIAKLIKFSLKIASLFFHRY